MALLKLCRCGKPINASLPMCETCAGKSNERHKLYDSHARDKHSTTFYRSKEWKAVSKVARQRDNNLCVQCLANNTIRKANVVDHIVPIKVDWSLRLSLANLQCLCHAHHNNKTASDKKIYGG